MASPCCYSKPQPLYSFIDPSGVHNSWDDHFFTRVGPAPGRQWQRVYYSQMPDWELKLMRKRNPEKPKFLIEHIRRDKGHLEGSSREMALLDKHPHLLPFVKRCDVHDLPDNSPWSSQNYAQRARGRYCVHERAAPGYQPGGRPQEVDNKTSKGLWLTQRRPSVSSASLSHGRSNAVDELPAREAPSTPEARLSNLTRIDYTPKYNGTQPRMPERAVITSIGQAIGDWWAKTTSSLLRENEPPESIASPPDPSPSPSSSSNFLTRSRADHYVSQALQNPPDLRVLRVQLPTQMEQDARTFDADAEQLRRMWLPVEPQPRVDPRTFGGAYNLAGTPGDVARAAQAPPQTRSSTSHNSLNSSSVPIRAHAVSDIELAAFQEWLRRWREGES
ncbi:uncharacterized protein L3040_006931 [Drepanopeziza brunnea f. sp. 'multigermtubi']|uniref:Uncharacterized protein n=1 Tax=Marssonina brunnea f. sp. multigermtubi (strain MB_m1) TaxID=1072389 RepID=K1XK25_MARBU|nr:uncharacterized protein MBM_09008 [Drepanopeziza brunnea f. sp. 'multigermtubi' MB_m1]EKD12779.1 hypothetical protein MBM_09008 [Drepanopeziza brunnea f. sp. 'multigermtubi' MB_m1]KAJ5038060.1 hypothetical protein L3040_006931 [Drepanopeziza brunnea f. sp. 'multigermtubi']